MKDRVKKVYPPTTVKPKPFGEIGPTCLLCKHFNLDIGSIGFSEVTPGDAFSMACDENHWEYPGLGAPDDGYRKCLMTAQHCPDYTMNPAILAELNPSSEVDNV
jgi:hypothetical protein